ncbi:MAG TPA: hypothetical protein ENN43_07120 [bacterium]|nr:hypothetical protein [bacterium]
MKTYSPYNAKALIGLLILAVAAAISLILLKSNGISGGSKPMVVTKATPKIPQAEPREAGLCKTPIPGIWE